MSPRHGRLVGLVLATFLLGAAAPASAAPPTPRIDRPPAPPAHHAPSRGPSPRSSGGTVSPGQDFNWTGPSRNGMNQAYTPNTGLPCDDLTDATRCDATLVNVGINPSFWQSHGGGVMFSIDGYSASTDFDLYVYSSDSSGTRGALVGSSAGPAGQAESTTVDKASGYYLVQVVYFDVTSSSYQGHARAYVHGATPPDVNAPPGFQDAPASDPGLGFRSHSEPHIARSPTNPNILVAGSKMYNRDPDSLPNYKFKIGTYVSFDGGRSWRDLGQLDTCPASESPPTSWPSNTCYPADDPNVSGGADYGENYITSDVWVDFDDEGNVYAMVLDSPPYPSGNGWGMTLHRWDSPSPEDVASGDTWSHRIPIDAYPTNPDQARYLDDKNTFAINNAGPDGDGKTGTMIACWGLNDTAPAAPRPQETVCKRSTDGGRTWPGSPLDISPGSQFVIGVDVVADTRDENTFYAVWKDTTPPLVANQSKLMVSRTTDGGVTWSQPVNAVSFLDVPNTFPGNAFRNTTIPTMGVGPNGELYVTYNPYLPAHSSSDLDGMQADVYMVKSIDGGRTWGPPAKVNQDTGDADQFQPSVAVTPSGQVDVAYFDRRNDPDNFFIDTYLSRSNDGGQSFTDVRVSHEMWDPSINPPISDSGQFIGDYQGVVANDCNVIAFDNDTTAANDPSRDPDFSPGPRSQFQQVRSYTVPNMPDLGGTSPSGCPPSGGTSQAGQGGGGQAPSPAVIPQVSPGETPATRGPRLGLRTRRIRVTRAGIARVGVRCPATAQTGCTGVAQLYVSSKTLRAAALRRVGRRALRLRPGQSATLSIRLSTPARRALRRRGRVAAVLRIAARDGTSPSRVTRARLALVAAR